MPLREQDLDRIDHDHLRELAGMQTAPAAERTARGVQRVGELRGIEGLGEQQIVEACRAAGARLDLLLKARTFFETDLAIGACDRDQRLCVEMPGALVELAASGHGRSPGGVR